MHIGSRAHFGLNNPNNKGIYCIETQKCYTTARECALKEFGVDNPGTINGICKACRGEQKQTKNKHFRFLTEEERRKLQRDAINDF